MSLTEGEDIATLNFTSTNEDGETELMALRGCQRILCLTGTGTRVLDLLAEDAREIVALDLNAAQNHLLELKIAAMRSLDRGACLAFLGMAPCSGRLDTYRRLSLNLTPQARHFFDGQKRAISGGVWHYGLWERLLRWNARFLSCRIGAVSALMRAPSIEDQSRLFDQHFQSSAAWSKLEAIGRDLVWRLAMREPAAAFLPDAREVSARIDADFRKASQSFLFRESDIATLALKGRHSARGPLPVHLREDTYEKVRGRLERIRLVTGGLADLPNLNVGRFDGFSLSDFGSYCDLSVYADSWKGIGHVALPDARFCERLFLNVMPPQSDRVMIDETLSRELSSRDRSIIYRVRAGVLRAC